MSKKNFYRLLHQDIKEAWLCQLIGTLPEFYGTNHDNVTHSYIGSRRKLPSKMKFVNSALVELDGGEFSIW